MKTYRDAHGRFRKPTDDERWATVSPADREILLNARERFAVAEQVFRGVHDQAFGDLLFLRGSQW